MPGTSQCLAVSLEVENLGSFFAVSRCDLRRPFTGEIGREQSRSRQRERGDDTKYKFLHESPFRGRARPLSNL